MAFMFKRCYKLKEIKGLKNFNTLNVRDMKAMFSQCTKLKSLDLSNFNTSNVIDMNSMFEDCNNYEKYEKSIPQLNKSKKPAKQLNIKKELIKVSFLSTDQLIQYDTECFNLDIFLVLEQKLFIKFPSLKNKKIMYLYGGNIISDKSLTLAELKMKNEAHILIQYIEEFN